ncbi:MAG: porin [Gammaproteobacteria bacterium]|nr:porin [Gammaproteobacteria bacterium]
MLPNTLHHSLIKPLIKKAIILPLVIPFATGTALAEDWTHKVRLNGFSDAIYQATDDSIPIHGASSEGGIDNRGSFAGTQFGFNITANINDRITLYSQISASHESKFVMHLDWGFMGIEVNDEFTLRAGNIKFPVGLVNEYVDVGYLYPWLRAPQSIYSEIVPNGPQVTRDGYSGASLLFSNSIGDWTLGADLFGGEVKMETADVRKTQGLTLRADWNDEVLFQLSSYNGLMDNATPVTMNNQKHEVTTFGVKADVNNIVLYSEYADVTMGTLAAMQAKTWYASLGYRIGRWLPIITYQNFEQGADASQQQTFSTLGFRYELMRNTALKMEFTRIKTKAGKGMFESTPTDNSTNQFGLGLSVMF